MSDNYTRNGIAIINPYGGVWTDRVFQTPEEANAFLAQFWKDVPNHDASKFQLALATLTITLDRTPGEPVFIAMPERNRT